MRRIHERCGVCWQRVEVFDFRGRSVLEPHAQVPGAYADGDPCPGGLTPLCAGACNSASMPNALFCDRCAPPESKEAQRER